jgi:hypothetical protein
VLTTPDPSTGAASGERGGDQLHSRPWQISAVEPDGLTLLSEHKEIAEAPLTWVREALLAAPIGGMLGSRAPLVLGIAPCWRPGN